MNLKHIIMDFIYSLVLYELKNINSGVVNGSITYNTSLYLDIISLTKDCTISGLSELLNVSKPSVTMKINEMEEKGLVLKKQSEKDKRVFYIDLTEKVKKEYLSSDTATNKVVNKLKKNYSEKDVATFIKMLTSIKQYYKEGSN